SDLTAADHYVIEVKDGSISTNKLADDAVTNEKLAAGSVTADKMKAAEDGSEEGMVPVADEEGNITYQKIDGSVIDAEDLMAWEGDLTDPNAEAATIEIVEGGENAVLVDTSLKVKGESITTDHIRNGTIQPEDIADADENQILVTDEEGKPEWK